jgi:spermidine/putrescine transport system substrate-binding protein
MKKLISILACAALLAGMLACLSACGGPQLNVCNWGEYISDGAEGSRDIIREFEKATGIKVKYSTFATNEALYAKLAGGGVKYDVIIPSDYLIERLVAEDRLEPLDFGKIPNAAYIAAEYRNLYFDPQGQYCVPYTVGMTGIIYNKNLVKSPPDSWAALWDPDYAGQVLQFESPRDAFGTAQLLLGQDTNSAKGADWRAAADKLKEQTPLVQAYVADEVYDILEGENAILGPYYAGDYVLMNENNPNLGFSFPKEGVNYFYDCMCVPKGARNLDAAMQFINFLLEPDVALANAEYIKCASPHTAVRDNPDYSCRGNPVLYPDPATVPPVKYYKNLPQDILTLMNNLWTEVKTK